MNQDSIDRIKANIETRLEEGGFKLNNTHFESGRNLHTEQYYFAKKYFQNTDNCDDIAKLLSSKLKELNFKTATTLIGFRNYLGLALNKTIELSGPNYNYTIIEEQDGQYIWQQSPSNLRRNLVIILPITCTCSKYVKLRKFLARFLLDNASQSKINNNFINIFLILQESLKEKESERIDIASLGASDKVSDIIVNKIYSDFNWIEINSKTIIFNNRTSVFDSKTKITSYTAHPLVRLYSKIYLPESCPLCFPEKDNISKERPLFSTHDNYETPSLIFGFPNFDKDSKRREFLNAFDSKKNIHLYGHTKVEGRSYLNYIRGNVFYDANKDNILSFFDRELSRRLTKSDNKIVFITADNKHNSNFLEDISSKGNSLRNKSTTILRFQQTNEFIDNFISLHSELINRVDVKVIYFVEVMSIGNTFKLISDYIKHSRKGEPEKYIGRHGFDLILTLVDRTPLFTRHEIMRKLYSDKITNQNPVERFVAFFKLNVPIISASHLGDPLEDNARNMKNIIKQCHLDSLKITIGRKISKQLPRNLPELGLLIREPSNLSYFPFTNREGQLDDQTYLLYKPSFNKERLDLLKLHLSHLLHCEFAKDKYQTSDLIDIRSVIESIVANNPGLEQYFVQEGNNNLALRDHQAERQIIHDTIVKMLSRHPFIYYKKIYEAIFQYCINELDKLHAQIEEKGIKSFIVFRRLKFYIRRSVELNSNFIISERFIKCIKAQYSKKRIAVIKKQYEDLRANIEVSHDKGDIGEEFYEAAKKNVQYKINQTISYFSFLLYCYKQLVYKNVYRSIRLEELINSETLLPDEINLPSGSHENLKEFVADPYFHFTGMVKAENIYPLFELTELHKTKLGERKPSGVINRTNYSEYYLTPGENNVNKLLGKSRHVNNKPKHEEIKTAISNMLNSLDLLDRKQNKLAYISKNDAEKETFNTELRDILDSVLSILQPGIPQGSLKYAFFIEFRRKHSDSPEENIYTILSDDNSDDADTVKLSRVGLIYNLLYGLYDEARNEQSLISILRSTNDEFLSFKEEYSGIELGEPEGRENHFRFRNGESLARVGNGKLSKRSQMKLSTLFKNDCFDAETGLGLNFLSKANMCIAFRLSKLLEPNNTVNEFRLEGQAVLLVTNSEPCNTESFLNFMSNEKVRLLLLIKEKLSDYLEKQFDNDAFIEVIENRNNVSYQRRLRHDFNELLTAQERVLIEILKGHDSEDNKTLLEIISNQIRGQLNATGLNVASAYKRIDKAKFERRLRLIFQTKHLGSRTIELSQVNMDLEFTSVELHPSLFDVVIPELVLNMKKHCPRKGSKGLSIVCSNNRFCFTNNVNVNIRKQKTGGERKRNGLNMCNDILKKLGLKKLQIHGQESPVYKIILEL